MVSFELAESTVCTKYSYGNPKRVGYRTTWPSKYYIDYPLCFEIYIYVLILHNIIFMFGRPLQKRIVKFKICKQPLNKTGRRYNINMNKVNKIFIRQYIPGQNNLLFVANRSGANGGSGRKILYPSRLPDWGFLNF